MSSGMYHKRWAKAGIGDASTTIHHNENVTQVIAPHTYGTSWNSVRWNKSLKSDNNDGYWSRSVSFFEPISKDYNINSSRSLPPRLGHFSSQLASKKNNELKNSGPYTRERSVRFGDSMLSQMNDKASSRTSRQLPWLSDTSRFSSPSTGFHV
ncbi:unnamed protein product [Onchocerca ochengi]|uniref:DUF4005 domain-containing protein n=1 Tax=Onchocerca ochengi TaxID=42157 RepID=A0A182E0I9_ONCOC|nr:unnamed protein product [Onchocerca ochengi]